MTDIEEGFAPNNGLAGNQASADAESVDSGDSDMKFDSFYSCLV